MTETVPYGIPLEREHRYDPPAALMALHREAPLRRLRYHPDGALGWIVTSHRLGRLVLADRRFKSRFTAPVKVPVPMPGLEALAGVEGEMPTAPGMFIDMDGAEHTRLRRKLTGAFTVRRTRQLEPRIGEIAAARIDALEAAGPGADLVAGFALPVPSLVICELLGVPYEDRDRFLADSSTLLTMSAEGEERAEANRRLFGYLAGLAAARRAEPQDDLLSDLAADDELSEEEVVGMAVLLLVAGHETTAKMLGLGTMALLENRDQWDLLRERPELIANGVEELLRYVGLVHTGIVRQAGEDFEFEGERIRAGEFMTVSVQTANRDGEHFESPDVFDVSRDARGHMTFGHGVHQCLGQQLARVEMRIAFEHLLRRLPGLRLAVPAAQVPLRTDQNFYGVSELPVTW
ncbi:cytochrome P450 [Glycomyces terrestris]|uniref:Cytochrome P450 n=1 Tax=Glycomyces terrestris TaxID=2493553 RepID=A0A426UV65_9ACTN|nr:cytochrome P450 [Glycomyces terrestris]RRR98235.1 cytochrome P450 [Glycomyces terrestris]